MSLDQFWRDYEEGCKELAGVTSVEKVIEICLRRWGKSAGDAFFPGGSGDEELLSILVDAGWRPAWVQAYYYFAIRQPEGDDGLTYVEGDIQRGVQRATS
jgi:hypothetical protein